MNLIEISFIEKEQVLFIFYKVLFNISHIWNNKLIIWVLQLIFQV